MGHHPVNHNIAQHSWGLHRSMETPISTSPPPKRVRGERGGRRVQRQKKLRELTEQGLYIPQSWKTLSPNSSHGSSHGAKKIPTKQQTGPGGPGSGEKSEDVQLDDVRSGEIQERPERKEDFVWVLVDRSPSPEFPSWGEAGEAEAGEAGNMETWLCFLIILAFSHMFPMGNREIHHDWGSSGIYLLHITLHSHGFSMAYL